MTAPTFGYDDTPMIPGASYHVHDGARPQPPVVNPDPVPSDAVVLFNGSDLSRWEAVADGSPAPWTLGDGFMEVLPSSGGIRTREAFGDCQLHLEWASPAEVKGESQGRGNSGVFLMSLYEIQVLDGYDNPTYADGITGAIYGQFPPVVNACRAPGLWQTYDIIWIAPRFEGDTLRSPARITLLHNGVLLHHDQELLGPTRHKTAPSYAPHPAKAPLMLQDHRDLVRFRNIWLRPL